MDSSIRRDRSDNTATTCCWRSFGVLKPRKQGTSPPRFFHLFLAAFINTSLHSFIQSTPYVSRSSWLATILTSHVARRLTSIQRYVVLFCSSRLNFACSTSIVLLLDTFFFFNVFLETEQPSLPDSSELPQTSSLPTALQSTANNHFDRIVLNRSIDFFLILGRLFLFNRQTIVQHETESSHDSVNHVSPPFPSNNVLVVDFSNMNATKQEPTWYPAFVTSNSTPHQRTRNRFCRAGCTGKPRPAFFPLLFE